jgi:hypothetical protein
METRASSSLSAALLDAEGEIDTDDDAGSSVFFCCTPGGAVDDSRIERRRAPPAPPGGIASLPNDMWVEVAAEMAKPMAGRVVRRAPQVKLPF